MASAVEKSSKQARSIDTSVSTNLMNETNVKFQSKVTNVGERNDLTVAGEGFQLQSKLHRQVTTHSESEPVDLAASQCSQTQQSMPICVVLPPM